jgi:hypothetical protein
MTDLMDLITMLTATDPSSSLHSSDRFGTLLQNPWGNAQRIPGYQGTNQGRSRLDYFNSLIFPPTRQEGTRVGTRRLSQTLTPQFVGLLNQIRNTKQIAMNPNLDQASLGAFANRAGPSSFHEGMPAEFHEGLPSQKGSYY